MSDLVTFLCSVLGATGAALMGIWLEEKRQKWWNSRRIGGETGEK